MPPALALDPLVIARAAYLAVYAAIFVIDLRTGLIPNVLTYPAIAAALLIRPDGFGPPPLSHLAAAFASALVFAAMTLRGWMGMGDTKLVVLIGLVNGPLLTAIALWIGFVSGGLVASALLVSGRKRRGETVAFGPFLAVGGAAVIVAGPQLLRLSGLGLLASY